MTRSWSLPDPGPRSGWRLLQPLSLQPLSGKLHPHSLAPLLPSPPSTGAFLLLLTPAHLWCPCRLPNRVPMPAPCLSPLPGLSLRPFTRLSDACCSCACVLSLTLCNPVVCSLPYKGLRNALRGIKLLQLPLEMKSSMKAYSVCQHHAQAWHSSRTCLLSTYYVAGTVLGSEDTAVKKIDFVPPLLEGSLYRETQKISNLKKKSDCVTQIYIIFICQSYLNRAGKKWTDT